MGSNLIQFNERENSSNSLDYEPYTRIKAMPLKSVQNIKLIKKTKTIFLLLGMRERVIIR